MNVPYKKEVLDVATSSITKSFVVSGQNQVEKFANAIEESYQNSLKHKEKTDFKITHSSGSEAVKALMAKRDKRYV